MSSPHAPQSPPAVSSAFLGWVTRLVHGHRAALLRLAQHEGLSAEEALDCVQEAFQSFLLLPQARSLVESPEESEALLRVVVRNIARNRRRRHEHARPHVSDEQVLEALPGELPSVEELISEAEEHVRLLGCITQLGRIQRQVVTLRMLDERPGEDVAASLGVKPGHVAVLLHRAKAALRHCMAEH
ncbi:MAG TPA: sigma-70 family RNA polymerase sigma factor [Archangium sp.]|jgi:RNA polymerase sigma-70 factor (ECF subfamily)|nr:sigma-70 family RNA polymerase sigma factor [Archangium sp.]